MSQYGQQPGGYGQPGHEGQQPGGFGPQGDYGQYQQQPGYGMSQQQYGGYGGAPAEHPQANTVLILGIVGLFFGILSFVAWYMGGNAKKEIEAGAPYQWDGGLKIGYWIGKIYSIVQIVLMALMIIFFIIVIAGGAMSY